MCICVYVCMCVCMHVYACNAEFHINVNDYSSSSFNLVHWHSLQLSN